MGKELSEEREVVIVEVSPRVPILVSLRLGPLREVLARLPRVFYEPDYMFLRQSLEGVVTWPEDDDRTEEAKIQEMTFNFDNWCRLNVNKAEVANNLLTMLTTPE